MNGQNRSLIKIGMTVDIVLKQDQRTGKLTRGHVERILTNSPTHPHGIKVMLVNVERILTNSPTHPHGIKVMLVEQHLVGRVQNIIEE